MWCITGYYPPPPLSPIDSWAFQARHNPAPFLLEGFSFFSFQLPREQLRTRLHFHRSITFAQPILAMVNGNSGGSASGSGYQYDPPPPPPPPALPHGSVPPGNNRPNPSTDPPTASSHRRGPSVFTRLQRGRPPPSASPQDPGGQRYPAPGSRLHGHTTSAEDQNPSNAGTSSPSARRSSHDAPITIPEDGRSIRGSQPYAGTSRQQASAPGANPGSRNQPGNAGPSRLSQNPLDGLWQTSYLYAQKSSYPPPPSVESVEEEEDEFANPRESQPTSPQKPETPSANEPVISGGPGAPEPGEILPPEILLRQPRPYATQGVPPPVGRPAHPFTLERTDTDASVLEIPTLQRTDTDVSIVEMPSREPRPYASQGPGSTRVAEETSGPDHPDPSLFPAREPRPYSSQGSKVSGASEETLPFFPPPRESRPYSSQESTANEDTLPFNPPRESRPYSSQGPGVSAAKGEAEDTTPPRPATYNARDLSSTEIALLPDCPKGHPVPWGSWFQVPNLPGFDVCSKCYYTFIHRSSFRPRFSPVVDRPDGIAVGCGFYTPRILQLWETALRGRNFESFLRYVEARTRIPHCNKLEPRTGGRWWIVQGDMPNFQVCEACYNDLVLASPFANRFAPHPAPRDEMYCSLGIPGLQKRFLRLIETRSPAHGNTWQDFVQSANYRISEVPKCAGAAYVHGPRDWWTCKKAIQGFAICEACYLDEVEPSLWRDKFVPIPNKQSRSGKWSCDFAIIPVKLSWQLALNDVAREFDDFWKCAGAALSMPPCRGQVINGGEWFKMLNTSNFSVCPTCYYTLIRALGFGSCFQREQHTKGSLSSCDLSPESPGYHALLTKLGEALDCRDFSRFEAYAHARSLVPPCPGSNAVTGRKWYGTDSFAACERCYKDIIEPSLLASQLTIHGATFTDAITCDIYSPRMRAIWAQACEMGNLDHFSAAAKHRAEVYFRTKAAMRTINETIGSQLELKCSLLANAATLNSIALTARSVRGHSTYSYGNLEVGYGYGSPEEVEAAALRRRAEAIGNGDPSLLQQLHELEQEWEAVE